MCNIAYHIFTKSSFLHVFGKRFVTCRLRTMSAVASAELADTEQSIQVNNKRVLEDPIENGTPKVQKIDELNNTRKKKKFALLLSYVGAKYLGMQRNPGCNTVEEQLLVALKKADLIDEKVFEEAQIMSFQRAARTDKGVSAAKQVVSLRLPDTVDKEEINKHLPDDIRVFGVQRATKAFNSKNYCTARTYMYIIPTYVFVPGDEPFLNEESYTILGKPYKQYRMTQAVRDSINEIGKSFLGSRNCHNVTAKLKPTDPRAYRVIHQFACTDTFIANDLEFAVLTIKGQSFLLHQIRKMVCLLIGTLRNVVAKDEILSIFSREKYMIGQAPGLGLILRNLHYDYYDKKFGDDGVHKPLTWEDSEEDVQKFLDNSIIKHIIETECSEQHAFNWLQSRHFHIVKDEVSETQEPLEPDVESKDPQEDDEEPEIPEIEKPLEQTEVMKSTLET